jgi:hypothetical protein
MIDRYFHIWGDDGHVSRQGRVIAQLDPMHYLVQFYDWVVGAPSTLHVFSVDTMTLANAKDERAPGAWQFYENHEHWRSWMEHSAPRRPSPREVAARDHEVDETFLALVARVTGRGELLSERANARDYAPRVLAAYPDAAGITQRELADAMRRLMEVGRIHLCEVGAGAKRRATLAITKAPVVETS